jgi:hypothetical protein
VPQAETKKIVEDCLLILSLGSGPNELLPEALAVQVLSLIILWKMDRLDA